MQEASRLESFVDMLRRLREPHLIASRSGLVLAANVAAADALGTSVSALEGTSLESYSPAPARLRERLLASPADAPFPLRARDGRRFFCDASVLAPDLLLLRFSGGPETAPRARVFFETLARLRGTPADDSARQTLEELSRALLTHGMTAVGAMAGGIFLLDESGANLELKGSVGYSDGNIDRFRLIPMSAPLPLCDTVRHATPVFLGSTADVTERYPALAQGHPDIVAGRAAACMPLVVEGRTIGAIGLGFARARTFGESDRDALRALAMQCAEVFEWAHRLEGGRAAAELDDRAASRLERLHVFTRALAQAITPAEVTEAVVDMGITATSARNGGLWLTSPDGSVVCLARSVGPSGPRVEDFVNVPLEGAPRLPVFDAIRTGTPVWIESCRQMEERYPEAFRAFSQGGESALACIPLFAQGRCIGGLTYNFEGAHRFLEDERAYLQVLCWHSAQAIERARLYAAEKRAREAAEASQRDAREADRQKDEFLAMLSHELRNPLAPIVTALELMKLRGGEAFVKERAIISRHVQHVVRLVDDLLDVARITRGKIRLQKERCEVSPLLAKAAEMVGPLVAERGQQLTISAPAHGLAVVADQARLTQAIANLLANAAKYTEMGGRIDVVARADGPEATIRVRDSGIGIAPETLPRIFDLFVQEKRALDRAQGGLGVGLTVVKGLVDLHGGSVSAHSEGIGRGSEFVVRLPLAARDADADAAPASGAQPSSEDAPAEGRLRVLVVDDNADAAEMLTQALRIFGCTVEAANDGTSALIAAAAFRPDLAIVDIGLPVMNGYELVAHLRRLEAAPKRIVALTGYGQDSDLQRSREAGFDEHIVKPLSLDVLRRVLDRGRDAVLRGPRP